MILGVALLSIGSVSASENQNQTNNTYISENQTILGEAAGEGTYTEKISGNDAIATSVAVAKKFGSASEALLARSDLFPDALCAGPLASQLNAPLLLTDPQTIRSDVLGVLESLGVKKVIIIGSDKAISIGIENTLKQKYQVERIGGKDRYETSALIAAKVNSNGYGILTTGLNWPDAISSTPFAASIGAPILITAYDKIPDVIKKVIDTKNLKMYILGGTAAVSQAVENQLKSMGRFKERIGGTDRYETSVLVAKKMISILASQGKAAKGLVIARGDTFCDAASSGPFAAINRMPVVLTKPNEMPSCLSEFIKGNVFERIYIIGGVSVDPPIKNPTTFTISQIQDAAGRVKSFIEINYKLPNYVEIAGKQVTMPQFLQLLITATIQLNQGVTTSLKLIDVGAPSNPTGDAKNGDIQKTEYLDIAQKVKSFIESNKIAPNYATSSLGKIQYESLIYIYSKIVKFYSTNGRLPSYVTNDLFTSDPQAYLKETKNCQVNDSRIRSLASSLTQGITSIYDKACKIFNWVRDNISYSFYYDTKYGAVDTLLNKTGNCVDHAHLLIALSRAAGIPARYVHGVCTFTSGSVYGHVWAQLLINNKWYVADATSSRNSLGVINSWDTNTAIIKGIYIELPF